MLPYKIDDWVEKESRISSISELEHPLNCLIINFSDLIIQLCQLRSISEQSEYIETDILPLFTDEKGFVREIEHNDSFLDMFYESYGDMGNYFVFNKLILSIYINNVNLKMNTIMKTRIFEFMFNHLMDCSLEIASITLQISTIASQESLESMEYFYCGIPIPTLESLWRKNEEILIDILCFLETLVKSEWNKEICFRIFLFYIDVMKEVFFDGSEFISCPSEITRTLSGLYYMSTYIENFHNLMIPYYLFIEKILEKDISGSYISALLIVYNSIKKLNYRDAIPFDFRVLIPIIQGQKCIKNDNCVDPVCISMEILKIVLQKSLKCYIKERQWVDTIIPSLNNYLIYGSLSQKYYSISLYKSILLIKSKFVRSSININDIVESILGFLNSNIHAMIIRTLKFLRNFFDLDDRQFTLAEEQREELEKTLRAISDEPSDTINSLCEIILENL